MGQENSPKAEGDIWLGQLRVQLAEVDIEIQAIVGRASSYPQLTENQRKTVIGDLIDGLEFTSDQEGSKKMLWDLVLERMHINAQVGMVKSYFGGDIFQPKQERKIKRIIRKRAEKEEWDSLRLNFTLRFQQCLMDLAKSSQTKIRAFGPFSSI
ncbi:chorismate mutase [Candidatus Microgenomates bacterium]|nr:chorismate mutase [Candidatus Microgenomates bacterium]